MQIVRIPVKLDKSFLIILGRNDRKLKEKLGKTPPSSPCAGMHANQQRAHQLPHHAHWLPLATISFQPCLPAFGETIDIYRDFFVIIYPGFLCFICQEHVSVWHFDQ